MCLLRFDELILDRREGEPQPVACGWIPGVMNAVQAVDLGQNEIDRLDDQWRRQRPPCLRPLRCSVKTLTASRSA